MVMIARQKTAPAGVRHAGMVSTGRGAAGSANARRTLAQAARALGATLLAVCVIAAGGAAGSLAWHHARRVDWEVWALADALVVAAGLLGAAVACWYALGVAAATVALIRGRSAPSWAGVLARATAAALAGVMLGTQAHAVDAAEVPSPGWLASAVMVTPSPPAAATPTATPSAAPAPEPAASRPAPTDPAPSVAASASPPPTAAPAPEAGAEVHLVMPGETLWDIAADLLAGTSTTVPDSRIASAWPLLYEHNRATVGEDPDLIHPGMRLSVPATMTGAGA